MDKIDRRDFLIKISLTTLTLIPYFNEINSTENSEEDLDTLIKKVKEKYKDVDFDEEIKLSYKLNLDKIWGMDLPGFIKNSMGATASFEANKNEGFLKMKAYVFVTKADYEIKTFYHNNELTHLQIIDGIYYNFIRRGDTFTLLPDENLTTNTFDEEINQDFSTTANDVITAAKNTLDGPRSNERIFVEDKEFDIPVIRYLTDKKELEKIIFDISGYNTVVKNIEYDGLRLNGKLIPIRGRVYIKGETRWFKIPYSLELYGQITV